MNTFKKYKAKVTGQQLGQAKSSGNLQVILKINPEYEYMTDGELYELDANDPVKGQTRTIWMTITPGTAERRIAELKMLSQQKGQTPSAFEQFDAALAGDKYIDLTGAEADVTFKTEIYNNKPQERWEIDLRTGSGAGKSKTEDRPEVAFVRQATAQFGHLFKAAPVAAGSGSDIPY